MSSVDKAPIVGLGTFDAEYAGGEVGDDEEEGFAGPEAVTGSGSVMRTTRSWSVARPRAVSSAGRVPRGHPKGLALIGPAHGGILADHALLEETEALWDWRLTQDADTLIKLLAYCVSCTVKPVHSPCADEIATAVAVDVA